MSESVPEAGGISRWLGSGLLSRVQAFSQVERGLFVSVIFIAASVLFLTVELALWATEAPYLDREFLPIAVGVQVVAIVVWMLMAAIGAVVRRHRSTHPLYVNVTLGLSVAEIVYGTHFFGWYTSLFSGVTYMGASTIAFVLFERRPVLIALGAGLLVWVAATAVQLAGVLSYAPLLARAPFGDGRLEPTWVFGLGGASFGLMVVFLVVVDDIVQRLRDREQRLARAMSVIRRYVPAQVAGAIIAGHDAAVDRHDRRRLTVVFCDIKDFTAISDRIEPEDLSRILNDYLSELAAIGERYGGTIDKFIGDAIMIFFGAPIATDDRDHALRAIRMAAEMQQQMEVLRARWLREGIEQPIFARIGINTGHASVGNFGSRSRMDYTAVGRQVNLAARLQTHSPPGGILIGHATYVLVQDEIACTPQGEIEVRGFEHPVRAYLVVVS